MVLQDLLKNQRVDFLESGHHHCRPGWIQLRECPFCQSDNYHLGFNLQLRFFVCWRCGGHNTFTVLRKLGLSGQEVKEFFDDFDSTAIPVERKREGLKEPEGRTELLYPHQSYLEGRGFDPRKLAWMWKLEGIGIAARLSWRIYIPIIYHTTRVSWTTRAIGNEATQRYLSASASEEAINHKHLIYGHDFCHHSIVVVEGPVDAWAVGPGAGALFGTAFSTAQVRKIAAIPYRYICFDSSRDAQAKAQDLCHQLSCFPGVTENVQLDAKDPGEASQRELRLLRRAARL